MGTSLLSKVTSRELIQDSDYLSSQVTINDTIYNEIAH